MQKKTLLPLAVVIVLGIIAVSYVLMQKEEAPSTQENNPNIATSDDKDDSSEPTTSEEGWKSYSSSELGLSFQYPEKASNMVSGLDGADGFVPVKVTEDVEKGAIYITYGPSDTLQSLRNETVNATLEDGKSDPWTKPFHGWMIAVKRIQGDDELNAFVKDYYGKGCYVDGKNELSQKDVYEITFKGEDWDKGADLGSTTCSWTPIYKILRAENSNLLISINRGGEASFDDEDGILNSIRFN
ncbi:MAG: hypothetical protein PHX30_00580 [Candidatus Pacebacteria bacterium]|nr:hypothetical protein [Candidatus Paceibacterota bacterium]